MPEGEGDSPVTVRVSRELLAILSEHWSEPIEIKILPPIDSEHYEMIARRAVATNFFRAGRVNE